MEKDLHQDRPLFNPSSEYESLRAEFLDGRKFVFERPILLITAAIAAFNFINNPIINFIPAILIALLIFNLWFTYNRYRSLARISAYINVVLEGDFFLPWIGWETYLRYQRIWLNTLTPEELANLLEKSPYYDRKNLSPGMMFYHAIFKFHKVIINSSVLVSVILCYLNISNSTLKLDEILFPMAGVVATIAVYLKTKHYFQENAPSQLVGAIEKNRAMCIYTYEFIKENYNDKNAFKASELEKEQRVST
jgi:hypothetical protein